MEAESARVAVTPMDLNSTFLAFESEFAAKPSREMIFAPSDLTACFVEEAAGAGGAVLSSELDFGEATSATAACLP